jgi:acyl-CoA-binding protein
MPLDFEEACKLVRENPRADIPQGDREMLYVCYKVATVGPRPNCARPGMMQMLRRSYWDAWDLYGATMSPANAKLTYAMIVSENSARLGLS